MLPENENRLSELDATGLNFEATELTLGLPGKSRGTSDDGAKAGMKRGFPETVDLNLGVGDSNRDCRQPENNIPNESKPPGAKAQVVGWPPVTAFRKNTLKSRKYVKVAVDGTPYLRKVDLQMYNSYQRLMSALEDMFSCLANGNYLNQKKIKEHVNGIEYVATYEDKDGDWMLVGDVPWKMFVESCKRLRLMKTSEEIGFAPRTPQNAQA